MTLMLQEGVGQAELAAMMGVDIRRIFRYIRLNVKCTHRYPDQFLIESMLSDENWERLMKLHAWES